jgi:adenylylsulfate kinase-like enzyme
MVYSFIGQPATGKTTLAKMLRQHFIDRQVTPVFLDGDELRKIFGNSFKPEHFTKEYREEHARVLHRFVKYMVEQGLIVITATVSPYRHLREELKTLTQTVELYVHKSDIREREQFNVKDYEMPLEYYIDIDTTNKTPEQSFQQVLESLNRTLDVPWIHGKLVG